MFPSPAQLNARNKSRNGEGLGPRLLQCISTGAAHTVMFYVFLNQRTPGGPQSSGRRTKLAYIYILPHVLRVFFFLCGSLMDSECTAANVQPLVDDGTAPSAAVSQTARRRRASESTEARERRLERERARRRQRLASETAEERERRLSQRRARDRARRAARSSPASETRLEQWRYAERRRRATESPAERATRLQDLSTRQQERIAAESPAERATRLQDLSTCQQERIAAESPAERATRLQDLSTRQQERIAAESPATRLQELSTRQQERITSETPEETAARRQRDREAHTHRPPPRSLLHQPGVHARMRRFHSQLASLEVSTCTTCLERFPGMTTRQTAAGTECIRCTHSPKAYSWENNMHPGPVPMELEVGVDSHCLSHLI